MKKFTAKEKEKYLKQNQKRAFAMMMKTNGGNKKMDHKKRAFTMTTKTNSGNRRMDNNKRVRFVVDSGASDHMVNDERLLEDIQDLENPVVISTAKSGETLRGTKTGKMRLKSVVGRNSIKNLQLYNVFLLLDLKKISFRLELASKNGKRVTFTDEEVIFEHEDEVIASGNFNDGLFYLDFIWDGKSTESGSCSAYVGKQESLETWHKRLEHLSTSGIEKLVKKGMVEGINLTSEELSKAGVCDGCLAGKQTANKFQNMKLPRSKRPLELVHSDVCGSMEEETYDGYRYFVTFIDDFTHFLVVYLMKHKSEVFECFKEFEAFASSYFETHISMLRCDR